MGKRKSSCHSKDAWILLGVLELIIVKIEKPISFIKD
jgi:hypothetical protein